MHPVWNKYQKNEVKTPFSPVKNAGFSQSVHYQGFTKLLQNCVFTTERTVGSPNARYSR